MIFLNGRHNPHQSTTQMSLRYLEVSTYYHSSDPSSCYQIGLIPYYLKPVEDNNDNRLSVPLCGYASTLADRQTEDLFALYCSTIRPLVDALLPLRQHLEPASDRYPGLTNIAVCYFGTLYRRYRGTRALSNRLIWINHLRDMHCGFRLKETTHWEPKSALEIVADVLGRSTASCPLSRTSFTVDDYLDFVQAKIDSTRKSRKIQHLLPSILL